MRCAPAAACAMALAPNVDVTHTPTPRLASPRLSAAASVLQHAVFVLFSLFVFYLLSLFRGTRAQTMPICGLILTNLGRIFACHGGISPDVSCTLISWLM